MDHSYHRPMTNETAELLREMSHEREKAQRVAAIGNQYRQRDTQERAAETFAQKVWNLIHPEEPQSVPTWWTGFARASEHLVHDPTGAPANSGEVQITPEQAFPATLVETWISSSMPVLKYSRLIETAPGTPIPALPYLETPPTAGGRAGEKQPMYSTAWDIVPATGTDIDAGLHLNISEVLIDGGFGPLTNLIMKSAVAAEASRQVAVAVETAAGAGGLANFDNSRYTPSVVVIPPSQLATVDASRYASAGLSVVLDGSVTKVLFVDPNAVIGWFRQGNMSQSEPSVFGTGVSYSAFGRVAIDPAGVAALTPGP